MCPHSTVVPSGVVARDTFADTAGSYHRRWVGVGVGTWGAHVRNACECGFECGGSGGNSFCKLDFLPLVADMHTECTYMHTTHASGRSACSQAYKYNILEFIAAYNCTFVIHASSINLTDQSLQELATIRKPPLLIFGMVGHVVQICTCTIAV